ncbi:hypothetical protein O6H91_05G091200 [Diphasiastrum complanatum]|uniref:Uncharacterized protein n=1 Tax=Diphasiastrum complanatum TaxID=34168 RepID=A0ACC2DQT1_DIPCM|nr:hypothetical protein O6H91_05G091200 [Diphasiastrum complanatum]
MAVSAALMPCLSSVAAADASLVCSSCSLMPSVALGKTYQTLTPSLPQPVHFKTLGRRRRRSVVGPVALFGGGKKGGEEKKFITKEQEPDQYWQTAAEKEGKGPMSTVLPYIVIFGFATPFIILAIGFVNGWIKVPVR